MDIPESKRPAILEAIQAGPHRKIEAIKRVREATGCGLKEAKDYVEQLSEQLPKNPATASAKPLPANKGCLGMLALLTALGLGGVVFLRKTLF